MQQQTQTMAEMLAPKLLEMGVKVTIPAGFDSDAIFIGIEVGGGVVELVANPKHHRGTPSAEQFDFNDLLEPAYTVSMMDAFKKELRKQPKIRDSSQNYLNLRKNRF